MPDPKRLFDLCFVVAIMVVFGGPFVFATDGATDVQVDGKPLTYWVAQATREGGPENLDKTVSALSTALKMDNPMVKVAAADALAVLGPKAKNAVPVLLEQFGHEFPWVRVSLFLPTW